MTELPVPCARCSAMMLIKISRDEVLLEPIGPAPIEQKEACPKCGAEWEIWFDPSGMLRTAHGAVPTAPGNIVMCVKCGDFATVSR